MGITIIPGGCRRSDNGKTQRKDCNTCGRDRTCEMAPYARDMAAMITYQWVSVSEELPPEGENLLYLEYPSEEHGGTVHYGCYDGSQYIELASGGSLPASSVIAWMPIPTVPKEIYPIRSTSRRARVHSPKASWEATDL